MDNLYSVTWIFRNNHEWIQSFPTAEERADFINRVGLVSHPDIDRVYTQFNRGESVDLKRVVR
jgi:hypothetical protein